MERVSALSFAEEWVTCRHSCHEIERHMALKQSVIGQDAAHNLNSMITKQQNGLVAQQDESSAKSVSQPDLHREMLARVKEIDVDDNKLFAEYQQDIQLNQPGEFKQKLKGCAADSLRVRLHAERRCCIMVPQTRNRLNADSRDCQTRNQWSIDNRECKGMRVQIAHVSVALDETKVRADSVSSTTQLARGRPRTLAVAAVKTKQSYLWRLEECDV